MSDMINLAVPYYCQRENTYVWYQKRKEDKYDKITNKKIYSKGEIIPNQKGKSLAPITCNITSLCMILHYFGITQDSPDDMLYKIFDSDEFKDDSKFATWRTTAYPAEDKCSGDLEGRANMKHVAHVLYGLEKDTEIETFSSLTLNRAKKFIENGMPVWFSYGALINIIGGKRTHSSVERL